MKLNAPFLVLAIASQACRGETDRSSDGTRAANLADCDYVCRKGIRHGAIVALQTAFYLTNERRQDPDCGPTCDAVLTSVMNTLYARLCLTTLDASADKRWRVAPRTEYVRFQCSGPEE